ncbi:hypothetical protein KY285_013644 [Solanum tuberosum]|nr:hypothetical protein KY285_013644 [Solanum tuberosum]
MEDQQLKALIAESMKEVKDSFANDLADMRGFFQEMVGKIVLMGAPQRDPFMDAPTTPTLRHKPTSVELGRFGGENPEAWLFQAERYFDFYGIVAAHRLTLASFYLDGEVLDWYRWLFRNKQLVGWDHFVEKVKIRFQPKGLESAEGRLAKLPQTTTVSEFRGRFEAMANQTNDISDIKGFVLAHGPKSFEEALDLAHIYEKRIQVEKGPVRPPFANRITPLLPNPSTKTFHDPSSKSIVPASLSTPTHNRPPLKRLTQAEIQSRRECGLCYYCEEKYTVGHKCKTPPHLLLLTDGSTMDPLLLDPFVTDDILAEDLQCLELQEHSAISYNALVGGSSPSTLRLTGQVNGTSIQILVDGGSTHNFIQERVAHFLFPVVVGSGQRLCCDGVARGITVLIQGTTLIEELFILSLHGADLVLGVSWLAKLDPVLTNYATRTLEFNVGGNQVVWQGESPTDVQPVQLHSLR